MRVDETPAGDSSEQDSPCDTQNRHRPMDMYELPNRLAHTVVEGAPVGPEGIEPLALLVSDHADPAGQHAVIQNSLLGPVGPAVKEPLALLVLDHADPAGQHAAIQNTMSLWEHLPAQPETSCGGGLVERKGDGMSGSGHGPGQSTYGGDHLPRASGSGGVPGQWTYGGIIVSRTSSADNSSITTDCATS